MSTGVATKTIPATEKCPWCGNWVSRAEFLEIKNKIAEAERKKLSTQRERMERELQKKLDKERSRLARTTEQKLQRMAAKQESAENRVTEMKAREKRTLQDARKVAEARATAAAQKKLTSMKRSLEKSNRKELQRQRTVLEKDRDVKILKAKVEANREREQLQKQVATLTRKLDRKTSNELGEGAEMDLFQSLRDEFQSDNVERIKKGQPGADIRHEIREKGQSCGVVLIDSKNRQRWRQEYVSKLRGDQIAGKAEYGLLATGVFQKGQKDLYIDADTGIIVVHPARAVEVIRLLRRAMIRMQMLGLSQQERADKRELVYQYVTSENYRRHLDEAGRLATELLQLEVEEQESHSKVWEKRGSLVTRMRNAVSEVDREVSSILQGETSSAAHPETSNEEAQ